MKAMKQHLAKNKLISISVIVIALLAVGIAGYVAKSVATPKAVKIPDSISSKLLFTPYVPAKLPVGYEIDPQTFYKQEEALLFSAVNAKGDKILFTEQSVPKNFDTSSFYSSALANRSRIDSLKYQAIYGELKGQKKYMAGITIKDTWLLIIGTFSKSQATDIANSLSAQND